MALPYLKIEPDLALQVLDKCIVDGYQLKDKINGEYSSQKDKVPILVSGWRQLVDQWTNSTLQKLAQVFVSQKELYNFRDAKVSALMRVNTNIAWNSLINQLEARISKLNEYDKDIHERFNIKFEIVGRDKITQIGNKGEVVINN